MSREGKRQGGYPGRDDEKNQENRSKGKNRNIQKRNSGDVYQYSDQFSERAGKEKSTQNPEK